MGKKSRKRPYNQPHQELQLHRFASMPQVEKRSDGHEYTVQKLTKATKEYRCPACQQLVRIGDNHVVAWLNDGLFNQGVENRRHWHKSCWERGLSPQW